VVVLRRRWPDPFTGTVRDDSVDIGPGSGGNGPPRTNGANNIGHMRPPPKANLDGISAWHVRTGRTALQNPEAAWGTIVKRPRDEHG
jgi:hypothetical protein